MTKTATKTPEITDFPAFDPAKATDQMRAFAEKGVEQSKETYARLKSGAEETQKTLEATLDSARAASNDMSVKAIAAMRANSQAGFDHLEALVGAKSLSEVFELQTAFLRKRVEMSVEQAKEFQAVSTKAMDDLSRPVKGAVDKAMKELKVA